MRSNGVVARKHARDRASIRALNERIAGARPSGMFIEFSCECGRSACGESIPLSVDEYEAVRRRHDYFAVSPGHDRPGRERVVEACSRFAVVVAARPEPVAA
jgi:hypothetical protein